MSRAGPVSNKVLGIILISLVLGRVTSRPESSNDETRTSLTVLVTDVRSDRGKVHFALYDSAEHFTDQPMAGTALPIKDRSAQWHIPELKPGVYAVAVFHDENNDGKFNSNFLGVPTEDYAFSNDARAGLGPPPWKKVSFDVVAGTNQHRIHMSRGR